MARPTRNRRSTKHRGNAAGMIESRGRTGRKPTGSEKGSASAKGSRRSGGLEPFVAPLGTAPDQVDDRVDLGRHGQYRFSCAKGVSSADTSANSSSTSAGSVLQRSLETTHLKTLDPDFRGGVLAGVPPSVR